MNTREPVNDARGSMWRRWDPHVHFPGTLFNDGFGKVSNETALDRLAARNPKIEVVGVTDYFTTASFRRVDEAWRAGAGESISYLFPNVELRLDTPTIKGPGVNIHILCPPAEVDRLDAFIGGLEFNWNGRPYRADDSGLVQLGRDLANNRTLELSAAQSIGASQFKVSFEQLLRNYNNDEWAQTNCLIALAGGRTDGSSGVRTADGQFAARRQSMERFADIIFSASPQQISFWLGHGADNESTLREVYRGQKLCLHGSDAHTLDRLGEPDLDRYTWLKGNASFETLTMASLAPLSRGHIGQMPPTAGHAFGRISRVDVDDRSWFVDGGIPVNPGLVAIIGARGSGKTALADILAVAAGSDQPFMNPASFVRRAGHLLASANATIQWTHGESSRQPLADARLVDDCESEVRYLSQQFVEQLCSADGITDDLVAEIERVVYNAWPIDERQGAADFRDFLEIRLSSARSRQAAQLEAIADIGRRVSDLRSAKEDLPRVQALRDEQLRIVRTLEEQASSLAAESALTDAGSRLAEVGAALASGQETLQQLDRKVTSLTALQTEIRLARGSKFQRYLAYLQSTYVHAGLTAETWNSFLTDFAGPVEQIVADALEIAKAQHAAAAGTTPDRSMPLDASVDLSTLTVARLRAEHMRLRELAGLDEQRTRKLGRLTEQVSAGRSKLSKLNADIRTTEGIDESIERETASRLDHYTEYFDALLEEEHELTSLYKPLSAILEQFGPTVAKLRLTVRRFVDIDAWAAKGEHLLDLRLTGPFRGTGELAKIARATLKSAWETGDGAAAAAAVSRFSVDYSPGIRQQSIASRSRDPEEYQRWERSVAEWLYGAQHVTLSYSLEYSGLNIERLSPGSRGIVLLLLYLAVDQEETHPLIIDQPEENLDPESVYTELVQLFQSASQRRQIIMVTHNANLVVNTDVDQVIVARCGSLEEGKLPELTYTAGGLEDPSIRGAVCEVLEGGAEAFRQRARRLRLTLDSDDRGGSGDAR